MEQTTARSIHKQVLLGTAPDKQGRVFATIKYSERGGKDRLSISGVVGPKQNGDCRGSTGQISGQPIERYEAGWNAETVTEFYRLWDRWHLNDMRAGCEHQREWNVRAMLEIVEYGLTTRASMRRTQLLTAAGEATARGELLDLEGDAEGRELLALGHDWYKARFTPPDADDGLSGCYEVKKRGSKAAGWVKQSENQYGLLCKPCPDCGYQYGSEWRHESVPVEVIDWLAARPETVCVNPWGA